MITFTTETGSVYQMRPNAPGTPGGTVRRLYGETPPTECFAPDGEWKSYQGMSELQRNYPVIIHWADGAPHQSTVTSHVTEIEDMS